MPTVIRLGSVDSAHVQTTPVHNGNVFANYVNSTKFDELSHLKMNPNSTTWHSNRIDHFSNIFLLSSNLELNLSSVKVNSLSRFKRCGNLANCYTLVNGARDTLLVVSLSSARASATHCRPTVHSAVRFRDRTFATRNFRLSPKKITIADICLLIRVRG